MAQPRDFSEPVQLLAFVLVSSPVWDSSLLDGLKEGFGGLRHTGELHPFARTSYYAEELGDMPYRGLLSFENLIDASSIAAFKQQSNRLEEKWASADGARSVNIDVGYMDVDKVVLPSYKRGPCKLYAGDGVWLDMQFTYAKGEFHPTAWAFEDFARNPYRKDLLLVREKYKKALKTMRTQASKPA